MKTSIASLQERLTDWIEWDLAMYQLGACLGFWPEFGGPVAYGADPWNGVKDVMHTTKYEPLGAILEWFLKDLVEVGCLEEKTVDRDGIPTAYYKWNGTYSGPADLSTMLS